MKQNEKRNNIKLLSFVNHIKRENKLLGDSLKTYCKKNNLNYTNTSRIMANSKTDIQLKTLLNMLDLHPERNIPRGLLYNNTSDVFELFNSLDELQKLKDDLENLIKK